MINEVKVNVIANEVVTQDKIIRVELEHSVKTEYAQGAISIEGIKGFVRSSKDQKSFEFIPNRKLIPGLRNVTLGEFKTETGKRFLKRLIIPIFISNSTAKIPEEYRVEHMVRFRVGELGVKRISSMKNTSEEYIELMKAVDRITDKPKEFCFDQKGNHINKEEIFKRIAENRRAKYGKIHEHLFNKLNLVSEEDQIEIAIWLKMEPYDQSSIKMSKVLPDKIPDEIVAYSQKMMSVCDSFLKEIAPKFSLKIMESDNAAPVVYALATREQISSLIEVDQISTIFLHSREGVLDLDDSIEIARNDHVHDLGYEGSKIKVAVWESGPDQTDDLDIEGFFDPTQADTSYHSRHTHGIIKNTEDGNPNGHAPDCLLYSANKYDLSALKWAVKDIGCTVISQSFHRREEAQESSLSYDDIYKDWLIVNWPYPTILQAAGNYYTGDSDNVDPPSNEYVNHKGFNSLAVGNHDDTAASMSASSVFRNPNSSHADREQPEISANGMGVTTVGLTLSGTSMAAPAAAGTVALIQEVNSLLKMWPEGCRAILLAGASTNITGDTWWNDVINDNDGSDGSGAIDGLESVYVAQNRRYAGSTASSRGWDVGTLYNSKFDSTGYYSREYKIKVPKSIFKLVKVKVALAWNSQVTSFSIFGFDFPLGSTLATDYDLKIYDEDGKLVSWSQSWDNSYEIAEFMGVSDKTYTVKIRKWSGDYESWYGIAWSAKSIFTFIPWQFERGLIVQYQPQFSYSYGIPFTGND